MCVAPAGFPCCLVERAGSWPGMSGAARCGGWRAALLAALLLAPLAAEDSLRPECPADAAALCSFTEEATAGEFFYKVSGHQVIINFRDGGYFDMQCVKNAVSLESPGMPRFPIPVRVGHVTLKSCAAPRNNSYAHALAALNVVAFTNLTLNDVPAAPPLSAAHLAGLAALQRLDVYSPDSGSLAPHALAGLAALRTLQLNKVRTPPAELTRLPRTLATLFLWYTGAERVHINTLPNLRLLDLRDDFPVDVNASAADALEEMCIMMPDKVVPEDALPPSLRVFQHNSWNDSHAAPLTRCPLLEKYSITGVNDNSTLSLPGAWVARCPRLAELTVSFVPLRDKLPAALLRNASALHKFTCTRCALSELPSGLFDDTHQLQYVDLSYNKIKSLPSGLFVNTYALETLNLSHNQLTHTVADSLAAVRTLKVLHLNHNENLGDLCHAGTNVVTVTGTSPLSSLTALTHLYLSHTRIQHVCGDWRERLHNLMHLDMSHIAFKDLTLTDLQYRRAKPDSIVFLGNDGEFELLYTRENYETVSSNRTSVIGYQAKVKVTGSLRCNCQTYWAALAFQSNRNHAPASGLVCGKKKLSAVDVDTLTCDAREQCAPLHLPAHCTCGAREDKDHGAIVIVTCERANLTALPRLPRAQHKWRLHLAYNNISTIHAADVAGDIVELDLRNSSVKHIDGEAAAKLANISLQLAGNELECGCEAFETLTALLGTTSRLRDAKDVRCAGGKALTAARRVPCMSFVGPAVAALAVLLGAALAVVGLLAQPKTRQHIKTILIWLGVLPPRPEPEDDCHRRFDAFVSYAHEDEEFVVDQLAERLESGSTPYKLCLHYRDWAPGEWIPAQIAASVRSSRRTVAVVSQHYLRSPWARAEFREAHGATLRDAVPRLVVVLLDDPASLPLDPELDAYVRHNTYVRWGDPWFWEKLRQALPPPRKPPPEKSAALAAPAEDAVRTPSDCARNETKTNIEQHEKCAVI